MNRLKVGDIIYRVNWGTEYEVLEVLEGVDNYRIFNKLHRTTVDWHYLMSLNGLTIKRTGPDSKSAIEQKIAFMYQRFEKRNEL